jgi:hypothetical protein
MQDLRARIPLCIDSKIGSGQSFLRCQTVWCAESLMTSSYRTDNPADPKQTDMNKAKNHE